MPFLSWVTGSLGSFPTDPHKRSWECQFGEDSELLSGQITGWEGPREKQATTEGPDQGYLLDPWKLFRGPGSFLAHPCIQKEPSTTFFLSWFLPQENEGKVQDGPPDVLLWVAWVAFKGPYSQFPVPVRNSLLFLTPPLLSITGMPFELVTPLMWRNGQAGQKN